MICKAGYSIIYDKGPFRVVSSSNGGVANCILQLPQGADFLNEVLMIFLLFRGLVLTDFSSNSRPVFLTLEEEEDGIIAIGLSSQICSLSSLDLQEEIVLSI